MDAAHMLAIASPPAEQMGWNLRALELAQTATGERARRWLASLYNNIGWTYHERGEFETALDYFEKALRERETAGAAGPTRIARWCVARALRSLGRLEEALAIQRALHAAYEQEGQPSGYVHEELGECYRGLGQADRARPHFAAAYRLLAADPWLAEQEPERLQRLRRLGGNEGSGE